MNLDMIFEPKEGLSCKPMALSLKRNGFGSDFNTEKEESIQKRLANAAGEMAKTEVDGFFHAVIVNDDLEKAYGELKTVVIDDDQ